MDNPDSHPLSAALTQRFGPDADAAQIANVTISMLRAIDAVLSPIIGRGGVAALYARGLYLTSAAHPWLSGPREATDPPLDFATLSAALTQQSPAEAMSAAGALLRTFYELLTTLVGGSLTEKLLASVWAHPLNGRAARDPSL